MRQALVRRAAGARDAIANGIFLLSSVFQFHDRQVLSPAVKRDVELHLRAGLAAHEPFCCRGWPNILVEIGHPVCDNGFALSWRLRAE